MDLAHETALAADRSNHAVTLEAPTRPDTSRNARHDDNFTTQTADNRPTAVIIGAGLGGLSAGIHLARQGWRVDMLEKNERSGGRMNQIVQDGFKIDMGPTMLMMPEVVEKLFTDCGRKASDYLQWSRITPAYRVTWPDGTHLDMGCNVAEMLPRIKAFSAADAERFPAFVAKMHSKYVNARHTFIEKPFNTLGSMMRPKTIGGMLKTLPYESVYSFVSRYLSDEKLRQAFTFQTLYLGISPYDCPAIYALLPYIEMEYGVWFPKGGTIALADSLEKLFKELGGNVHYNVSAQEILLQGKRAVGVRTDDGTTWKSDVVVSNMDLPTAYKKLLPASVRRVNSDARLDKKEYGCSGYLLYLGVKKIESDWPHNTIVLSEHYKEILDDICGAKRLPRDPAMHVCIPTRTDPSLAPPGHDVVYVLVPAPNTLGKVDWQREAPLLRERVLDKLEATGLPGLRKNIVFEREFTPPEFETLYGCAAGSAYGGLAHTFLQSAYFRPHSRSEDIRDLYFVGASTHPGGGVPIVLTSGRLAAEEIAATRKR